MDVNNPSQLVPKDPPPAPAAPTAPAPAPAPAPCSECAALKAENEQLADTLGKALDAEVKARTERDDAVATLNTLAKSVQTGTPPAAPAVTGPAAPVAPSVPAAPAAAGPVKPSWSEKALHWPGRVPGVVYDAYYAARG